MFTKLLGVYELRMYDIVLGKTEQWVHRLVQGLPDRCKLSEPVGIWFTEFGPVNTGEFTHMTWYSYERLKFLHKFMFELFQLLLFLAIMLWSYQSLDDRTRIRQEAQQLEEWVEAGKAQLFRFTVGLTSRAFSSLVSVHVFHHNRVPQELRQSFTDPLDLQDSYSSSILTVGKAAG